MVQVAKRNGELESLDLNKIHRVLEWAADGLDVSVSEVEIASQLHFTDGIKTSQIHQVLIGAAEGLASSKTPDYLRMTARLGFFDIRKRAYGGFEPPKLIDHVYALVGAGRYTRDLLEYMPEEFEQLEAALDHNLDLTYPYSAYKEFMAKYLVRDKITNQIFESPQMAFMAQAMALFGMETENRIRLVIGYYNKISRLQISQPTPIMAGVRTNEKQFASCIKIDQGDSIDSIGESARAAFRYISRKAGIGINVGSNRGVNAPVRGGESTNSGIVNFVIAIEGIINSTNQGSLRKGSATLYFPWWHLEFPELIVLKNNGGIRGENRAPGLDYAVQINTFLMKRIQRKQSVSLFSPYDVPGLYDAFFKDPAEFERLYEQYEADPSIRKRELSAMELFDKICLERINTARIYIHNIDHVNSHSPWVRSIAPIRMSNLCIEIGIPTLPIGEDPAGVLKNDDARDFGEIGVCILSAINLGAPEFNPYTPDGLLYIEETCYYANRALDNLIDYQDYAMRQAERSVKKYRTLGIGVINGAYYLAKHGVKYSDGSANQLVHDTFEALAYYHLKASIRLAQERGPAPGYADSHAAHGRLIIDTYNRNVDELVPDGGKLKLDWDALRKAQATYGIRNITQTALMPSETSSRVSGGTNAFDPPQADLSIKANNDFSIKVLAPEHDRLNYEYAWDMPHTRGLLAIYAIIQKFTSQLISANTFYVPSRYPSSKLPITEVRKDIFYAYKYGVKSLYYMRYPDGAKDDHSTRAVKRPVAEPVAAAPESGLNIIEPTKAEMTEEDRLFQQQLDDAGCAGGACAV